MGQIKYRSGEKTHEKTNRFNITATNFVSEQLLMRKLFSS